MSPDQTPILPMETVLNNAAWFIDDLPDGGKLLKLVPLAVAMTPQGPQQVPIGTAVSIAFNPDGWDRFQRDVAAGKKSPVVIASGLAGNGNGGSPN